MQTTDLVDYLDNYLDIANVPDYKDAFNGLQVEGSPTVTQIAVAVDACQATILAAIAGDAQMMIVHHGLFWGRQAPITGAYYQRVSALIDYNMALYSCHIPLDAHPEVGNNHVLARQLGLTVGGLWGDHDGTPIGVWADTNITRDEFVGRIHDTLSIEPFVMKTGPENINRIGIVTGGAGSMIGEAIRAGCDTFLTGEGPHHTYFDAEEGGINVVYAGHYATETVGVKALAAHLERRFRLETFFIDHPTGL